MSPVIPVRCHIESAATVAPVAIRYFGCTDPISFPVMGIITMVTRPPGESTSPARKAV